MRSARCWSESVKPGTNALLNGLSLPSPAFGPLVISRPPRS